jgi:uncharacterized membrane protein
MDRRQPVRLRSIAAINGHPLHSLLVTFSIGFLMGALHLSGDPTAVTGAELSWANLK